MDTGIIIVTIVLVTVCVLPFYLMGRKNNKKKKEILKNLSGFAAKNACTVGKNDLWGEYLIAIDRSNQMLLYSDNATDHSTYRMFGLIGLRNCSVTKSHNRNGGIKKLGLQMAFANDKNVIVEFFNDDRKMALHEELVLANKWAGIINSNVK